MLKKIYADAPNMKEVDDVISALRDGEVIIYPTGTGYAYGCDALQNRSVERICTIKGIDPKKKSLSIMCESMRDISEYCRMSNDAFKFIKEHDGNYTYVLPAASTLPKLFKNRKEVGVRLVQHPVARIILQELGSPMLTSSLPQDEENPEYATDPELIMERYGHQVNIIVDGGIATYGPSTVIDCTVVPFEVLRLGSGRLDTDEPLVHIK